MRPGSQMGCLCDMIENPNCLKRGQMLGEGIYVLGRLKTKVLKNDEFEALGVFLGVPQISDTFPTLDRIELHSTIIY